MWLRWQWRVFYDKNEIINFSWDQSDDVKYQIPIHSASWQMGAHQCFCVSKLFYKINRQIIQIQVNCLTIWFLFIFFNFFFWHIKGASVCTFIKTFLWCLVKVWRYTRLQTLKSIWVTTTHKFYLSSVSPKFLWVFVSQNKICIFVVYSHWHKMILLPVFPYTWSLIHFWCIGFFGYIGSNRIKFLHLYTRKWSRNVL